MTAFGEQVVALLDHLGADQAVIGGTSLGANVSLEVADVAPERVRGLLAGDAGARQRPGGRPDRLRPADVPGALRAALDHADPAAVPAGAARASSRSGPGSAWTPSTSTRRRWPRPSTASSSAGSPRPASGAGRSPPRRWSSGTRATRSTRPRTPRCSPTRCRTPGSCAAQEHPRVAVPARPPRRRGRRVRHGVLGASRRVGANARLTPVESARTTFRPRRVGANARLPAGPVGTAGVREGQWPRGALP